MLGGVYSFLYFYGMPFKKLKRVDYEYFCKDIEMWNLNYPESICVKSFGATSYNNLINSKSNRFAVLLLILNDS